jgi:hypothetical protein
LVFLNRKVPETMADDDEEQRLDAEIAAIEAQIAADAEAEGDGKKERKSQTKFRGEAKEWQFVRHLTPAAAVQYVEKPRERGLLVGTKDNGKKKTVYNFKCEHFKTGCTFFERTIIYKNGDQAVVEISGAHGSHSQKVGRGVGASRADVMALHKAGTTGAKGLSRTLFFRPRCACLLAAFLCSSNPTPTAVTAALRKINEDREPDERIPLPSTQVLKNCLGYQTQKSGGGKALSRSTLEGIFAKHGPMSLSLQDPACVDKGFVVAKQHENKY